MLFRVDSRLPSFDATYDSLRSVSASPITRLTNQACNLWNGWSTIVEHCTANLTHYVAYNVRIRVFQTPSLGLYLDIVCFHRMLTRSSCGKWKKCEPSKCLRDIIDVQLLRSSFRRTVAFWLPWGPTTTTGWLYTIGRTRCSFAQPGELR